MNLESLDLAHTVVDAIADRLGSHIVVLDMQGITLLADYFVLCNAESTPQFRAIADEVDKRMAAAGHRKRHVEGEPESGWVLLDYGVIVVHIFQPKLRTYYNLEGLWNKARLVVQIQ